MRHVGPHVRFSPSIVRSIIAEVAQAHKLHPDDLTGRARFGPLILARQEAIWRVRTETKASLIAIGGEFGGRDHTTIRWGVAQHEKRMAEASA